MGLILDSTVLVAAERLGKNARQLLSEISAKIGDTEVAISVITLVELAHGAARAESELRRKKRSQFIEELATGLPVYPVTAAVALRAGHLDGGCQARGHQIPLSDLLIGVTALELEFGVLTHNLRHFRQIPGLPVIPF
jgi:tRNA(fMet)-specific endonuclease VapC